MPPPPADLELETVSPFWRWQVAGWLAYGLAMLIAAAQVPTVDQALVYKTVNVGIGFTLMLGAERGEFDTRHVSHVAKGGVLYAQDGRWVGPTPGS